MVYSSYDPKNDMIEAINNCKDNHLILDNKFSHFDFSLLKNKTNITKITLSKSFKSLNLIPYADDFDNDLKHIEEIVIPVTVNDIDILGRRFDNSTVSWPHFTFEKRNKTYFKYEHGIYNVEDMSLIYIEPDYDGVFTVFRNAKKISVNVFKNRKISGLIVPKGICINVDLRSYREREYFFSCTNLIKIDLQNPVDTIEPLWFTDSSTGKYSQFIQIVLNSSPNIIIDYYIAKNLNIIVKAFLENEIPEENKELWLKRIKEKIGYFYRNFLENIDLLEFGINKQLLTVDSILDLIKISKEKEFKGKISEDVLSLLKKYKDENISQIQIEQHNEKEKIEKKELKEKIEARATKNKVKKAIRTHWQCFQINSDNMGIKNYKGCKKDIEIPKILDGKTITTIGSYAFSPIADNITQEQEDVRRNITSVIIPNTVTEIQEHAFMNCIYLEKVQLPASLKFESDNNDYGIFKDCFSLEKLEIPEGVTNLYKNALSNNNYLEEIILPESLETIGDYAFSNCKSLQKIVIPSSVKSIGRSAFLSCKDLKVVVILNPNIEIEEHLYRINDNVKFIGENNSNISHYAKTHNIEFSDNLDDYKDILNKE